MEYLFCISAGQLITKKEDNIVNRRNRYLNYGLLSLASMLKEKGWNSIQIQGLFDYPLDTLKKCIDFGFSENSNLPILISIPSFYAVSWVNEFIGLIKEINSKIKIIIGGRWVISDRPDLMKEIIPLADVIIKGMADRNIESIILENSKLEKSSFLKIREYLKPPSLDYSILYERNLYQPSIEVSRGCGMGCVFCQEKDEKLSSLKNPESIIKEVRSTLLSDNLNQMNIYFEASMFIPNKSWIDSLVSLTENNDFSFNWRTESRVDTINPKLIKMLSRSGLKVLDLGLESASHIQLSRMKKARDPIKYLERAETLLKECKKYGVEVKVNILLFSGETEDTINETMQWLYKNKQYIKGVSVGPVIVYGWESDTNDYISELKQYGSSLAHSPTTGVQHINLSKNIDYKKSIVLSKEISDEFMSPEDYFYLKSFSYFSRDYTYSDFLKDLS